MLLAHSGLQLGGEPIYPEMHAQEGESLTTLHSEFGPQGEGWHGFNFGGGISAKIYIFLLQRYYLTSC